MTFMFIGVVILYVLWAITFICLVVVTNKREKEARRYSEDAAYDRCLLHQACEQIAILKKNAFPSVNLPKDYCESMRVLLQPDLSIKDVEILSLFIPPLDISICLHSGRVKEITKVLGYEVWTDTILEEWMPLIEAAMKNKINDKLEKYYNS